MRRTGAGTLRRRKYGARATCVAARASQLSPVAKARSAVAARIGERIPVSELARSLGVSRRTLELRFRAETGVPIGEAILNERLARAKDLLRTTSLSCEQIAAACGVCDANHLGHLFRRRFGASPSAFRKGS